MRGLKLGVALAAAMVAFDISPTIEFGAYGHRISDPYKPKTRHRRNKQSPADRLLSSAQKKRRGE